ncbi:MAG: aminotransferase class III-fold pyridoxal phosphate-dependent enzyme [Gammaproteobacteria bacterium]
MIIEPVQGLAGAYDFGKEYLAALRKRCDETGALLVFDEVQCGTGRVGHPFAANLYGVKPDMITAAKALGNGFPCAALLTSPKVSAAIKLDSLGTTYGGGPMAGARPSKRASKPSSRSICWRTCARCRTTSARPASWGR